MWAALASLISAIPSAATSPFALGAYALAAAVYALSVWRVSRNKNLLANLQKLPPKDRMKVLEIEMGGVRLKTGISPEQWVHSRIHRYYFLAFLATCAVAVTIVALALFARNADPPRTGSTFINNLTLVEQQYLQINNNQPLDTQLKQQIREAIELTARREFSRAQHAFLRLPDSARVPAVWNDLGVAFEGLGDQQRARDAYAKALQQKPDFAPAQENLARLSKLPGDGSAAQAGDQKNAIVPAAASAKPRDAAPLIPVSTAAAQTNLINLLAPENGGAAVIIPRKDWEKSINGKDEDTASVGISDEAVFAFKDERPATFRIFSMLISAQGGQNPKEIEILAADELSADAFRSLRKCTFINSLVVKAPYQECVLPETTAKYAKVRILSNFGAGWTYLPQLRLLGTPVK